MAKSYFSSFALILNICPLNDQNRASALSLITPLLQLIVATEWTVLTDMDELHIGTCLKLGLLDDEMDSLWMALRQDIWPC